jgi:hypothetical protein
MPLVEAGINDTGPYRLLIDLGSNVTLLRKDVVARSGGEVLFARPSSDIVQVEVVRLGEARLEDVTVGAYENLDVDGVIGYNVLQYSSFTLDFPNRRFELHRRALPPPDGRSIFSYELQGRMPYVRVTLGTESLPLNLDTGATEWVTIPPRLQSRLRWLKPPAPGRTVTNNQTGRIRILEAHLAGTLRLGPLEIPEPLVYINPDADDAWLGAAAMSRAVWTFDPRQLRVKVTVPKQQRSFKVRGAELIPRLFARGPDD